MVVFNYSGAEINAKVVYYGPALSGKTTNLEHVYAKMPADTKGKMVSMKTRTDRTLFFDFLPLELGEINGYRVRILLYTVPGQVYYNATRKLVLKGADAVVFVADSSASKVEENIESLRNLEENLNEHGLTLDTIPWVIQYNKRDLPDALPVEQLAAKLNLLNVPSFEATATTGEGIYETFRAIAGLLYQQLAERLKQAQPAPKNVAHPKVARAAPTAKEPAASQPKAPSPRARRGAGEDPSVSDVLDAALREVDVPEETAPPPSRGRKTKTRARPRTATPKPVVPSGAPTDESLDKEFQFAPLDDKDVGRIIDFEDTSGAEAPSEPTPEFITDPFSPGKSPAKGKRAAEPDPVPAAGPPPDTGPHDEVTVTVPVVLTRSQMRKTIPIRIALEVQFVDEET